MNVKEIRELAKIMRDLDLTKLKVNDDGLSIHLERGKEPVVVGQAMPAALPTEPKSEEHVESTVDFNRAFDVKAALVGVFYAAPAPEAQPFVTVGSRVKAGDVLCVIEAMKLMNEITADRDGEIVDVCVKNGDVVEFGQTLFKLC